MESYKTKVITITIDGKQVEREVTTAVLVDSDGQLYGGYSVKNPSDPTSNVEMARTIAKGRATNQRTNLLKLEQLTFGLRSKIVLKSINYELMHQISKGKIKIVGVK